MKKNSFLKNTIFVIISNIVSILSGVLLGFFIPKVMTISDYSMYKIYTLYIGYIGLFSIGFSEGVYLKYAGCNEENVNFQSLRTYSIFYIIVESVFFLLLLPILFALNETYRIVFIFVFLYMYIVNLTSYFQNLSQAFSKFREYSILNGIRSALSAISIIVLFVIYNSKDDLSFILFIFILTSINLLLLLLYIYRYRKYVFGKHSKFYEERNEIFKLIKIGFPLLIGEFIGSIVLNVDRQFVSLFYDGDTYAYYAFA